MSRTDSASIVVDATPEAVYAAMTEPEALAAWLPPSGMRGEMRAFDLRPGGHYRMVLHYEDGSTRRTHRRNSEGVLFTTSSHRVQISCPVVAVYIDVLRRRAASRS